MNPDLNPVFMRPKAVSQYLGISRTKLHYLSEQDPDFPRKIILSPRLVGWRKTDVDAWLDSKAGGHNENC